MPGRFDTSRAATLVRAARLDSGLSQAALAKTAGMSQPHNAAIETGVRGVSENILERLLHAADYRPSMAVEEHAGSIVSLGARHGLTDLRVFGSVASGADHFSSDIDLLARVAPGRSYLDIAMFQNAVENLTGFPVDVVADTENRPAFLDDAQLVAL
jgi:predicted nucleotidyltransferase